jgi:hypothetical protein
VDTHFEMPKAQIKVLVGYCIFMLLMTQFLQRSDAFQRLLTPFAALFGSFLPIAISVFAIKNGWAIGRVRMIDRDDSPISYWFLVALGFSLGAFLLYQGVKGLATL